MMSDAVYSTLQTLKNYKFVILVAILMLVVAVYNTSNKLFYEFGTDDIGLQFLYH